MLRPLVLGHRLPLRKCGLLSLLLRCALCVGLGSQVQQLVGLEGVQSAYPSSTARLLRQVSLLRNRVGQTGS